MTGRSSLSLFAKAPDVKKKLWGEGWGKGCFVNTIGEHGREKVIAESVK
jgi:REP element-mobilizing transposase RayT